MKILFITPAYESAWAFGGVVKSLTTLCRALVKAGIDVSVYTTNVDGTGGYLKVTPEVCIDLGGVKVWYFRPTFGIKTGFDSRQLINHLKKTVKNFDLVYVSAIWQWIGISACRVVAGSDIPLVIATRGSLDRILFNRKRWKKLLFWHLFLRGAINRSKVIHFTTDYELKESERCLRGFRHFIVPNTILVSDFKRDEILRSEFRKKYNIPNEAKVILNIGRLDEPKKNINLLFSSLMPIMKRNNDVYLLLAGPAKDEWKRKIIDLAKLNGISHQLIMTGLISGEDLKAVYSAGDVFALISDDENFGNVVVEAMASGLPVLISDRVGIYPDVIEDYAGEVINLEEKDITQTIERMLSDLILLEKMGHNAQRCSLRYIPEIVAKMMVTEFKKLLDKKSTSYIVSLKYAPGLKKYFFLIGKNLEKVNNEVRYLLSKEYSRMIENGSRNICYLTTSSNITTMIEDILKFIFKDWLRVWKEFKKLPPKFLLFYNPHPLNFIVAELAKKVLPGSIISIYLHEPYMPNKKAYGFLKSFYINLVEYFQSLCIRQTNHIILPSSVACERFKGRYPDYPGETHISPILTQDLYSNRNSRRKYYSIIGNIHKATGHDLFFKLMDYVARNGEDFNFFIVTSCDVSNYVKHMNKNTISMLQILRKNFISDEEINEIILNSIAVFKMDKEITQSGIVPLCFMNGTPLIARNIPGFVQDIRHDYNGYLFSDEDSLGEISNYMKSTLKNINRLSDNCRKTYEETFSEKNWSKYYSWLEEKLKN